MPDSILMRCTGRAGFFRNEKLITYDCRDKKMRTYNYRHEKSAVDDYRDDNQTAVDTVSGFVVTKSLP